MSRNISETARVLGVERDQVKKMASLFHEYLSSDANPPKPRTRTFSDSDLLVLAYVCDQWEADPDLESIKIGLNQENHHDERFVEHLYMHTPLLQEPTDDLDETWRHGMLLNGGGVNEYLKLARDYRQGAEVLLDSALESREPLDWGYPVLFAYRHTLELYLKIIGEIDEVTHSLKRCLHLVERRHGKKIGSPIKEWILELDKIDPAGTAFRYADDEAGALQWSEHWVDFVQFKFAMKQVFEMIDHTILHVGARGKPAKKPAENQRRKLSDE